MKYPPEAYEDFDEVPVEKIKEWREKLAEEFGFGGINWENVDTPIFRLMEPNLENGTE